MRTKLTQEEINDRVNLDNFMQFYDLSEAEEMNGQFVSKESGICFLDEDDNVLSMYKTESPEEADITLKKVVSVYELGEEEISKFAKVKHIIKGFLEICFRKKISVVILSVMFGWMVTMGIKEKNIAVVIIYVWAYFMITNTGKAFNFLKEVKQMYKLRGEAISDSEFLEFVRNSVTEDVADIKLYLLLDK